MAKIGKFAAVGDEFHGFVATLSVQCQDVRIVPHEMGGADRRSWRDGTHAVRVGETVIGAAWSKLPHYMEVELDDPSFAAEIRAILFPGREDGSFDLVWSRHRG